MGVNDDFYTTDYLIECGRIRPQTAMLCQKNCPCGRPIYRNWKLTQALCLDPYCKYHLKYKAAEMFKYLNVKGLGSETCGMYIQRFGIKNHFDLIPYIFKQSKPRLYLWEIALLAGIPSYANKLEEILVGYNTFMEFFYKEKNLPKIIYLYKDMLTKAQSYFDVKPSLAKDSIKVMITGEITGFSPRSTFIKACNKIAGDVIRIKLVEKGQNRDYLITENPNTNTGKIKDAIKGGVNIVHPVVFLDELEKIYSEKIKRKNSYYNEEDRF